MENTAFYLKYRPQTLDELIGQETVKKILLSSFENRLAHAYLFVGPRGTGKTSTARILAKMVNCEVPKEGMVPCNKCTTCISVTDGSNLDLIEIDAASNRGIEDIRSLRDKIKLAPSNCRKKVYIIDEVHMLTTEAFNALLKTLEEPPKHALFILATTEVSKIPQTILSRVQRLDFKLASPQEILQALEVIIKTEKIDIEEAALKILVRKADGSFRDAVKFLDQVSSMKGRITAESLEKFLKSTQFDDLTTLIKNLLRHKTTESLLLINKQIEHGTDIRELTLALMDILRNLVFIKNGLGPQLVAAKFSKEGYEELVVLSEYSQTQSLVNILNILQNYLEKLRFASIPTLPLELAVVEICSDSSAILSETKDLSRIRNISNDTSLVLLRNKLRDSSSDKNRSQNDEIITQDMKKVPKEAIPEIENSLPIIPPVIIDAPSEPNLKPDSDSSDILKLKEKWTFVLETIRPFNFSLEALLRSINVRECSKEIVTVEVPYSFHQRIMEAPKNRDLLESILSDILGRQIKISIILGNRPERKEDIANVELAADDDIIRAAAEIFNSDSIN